MATDGELADAILRRIASDTEFGVCIMVERDRGPLALIDSSWFTVTAEEADYLDRIAEEGDG